MRNLSIRMKLGAAFAALLVIVLGLGVFALDRISAVNEIGNEIGDNWLPSVSLIGALNTALGDHRAAEADHLISDDEKSMAASEAEMAAIVQKIGDLRREYEKVITSQAE